MWKILRVMGTKIFDKKLISPERMQEIEERATRNYELAMQGYNFEDTQKDIDNLTRILHSEKDLFSPNIRFV